MSEQRQQYIIFRLAGYIKTEAARLAGYANPSVHAHALEIHPEVIAALGGNPPEQISQAASAIVNDRAKIIEEDFDDPIEFLKHVTNNKKCDLKLRMEAAAKWAGFTKQKVGEKGKKQIAADAAKEKSTGSSKFASGPAPQPTPLRAVKHA